MNASPTAVPVDVTVDDRQHHAVDHAHLAALLTAALLDQQAPTPAEVGLTFIDVDEMTELNQHHMAGAGPTDVLAFPIDGMQRPPIGQPTMLGDIVICPEVAVRAPQDLSDELALLVVHGALHLLGHDHAEPDEAAVMAAIQVDVLSRFHEAAL